MTQLDRVREAVARAKLGALLLMDDKNIYYACGFMPTDSAALITPERAWLITDSRYTEDAARSCYGGVEILLNSNAQPMMQTLGRLCAEIVLFKGHGQLAHVLRILSGRIGQGHDSARNSSRTSDKGSRPLPDDGEHL